MGKRSKTPKRMLSLDEQLAEHDRSAPPGPRYYAAFVHEPHLEPPSSERMAWVKRRLELVDAIRRRDAKRMDDHDKPGSFAPSAYATQHAHDVETAPKDLDKVLPRESQLPKRYPVKNILDWYFRHRYISKAEWQAGNRLREIWYTSGLEAKVTSGYEPVTTSGLASQDHKIAKRLDAVIALTALLGDIVPYHCRGVVRAVAIDGINASDWARRRGYGDRDSERRGMRRLRAGLTALAKHFAC